ncbi:MAG: response regulator transcription factor [Myxococcales bacterium FL481]|nr:MAG: response regulator transcription factor [Myxococcales bacterium FL481]
MDAAPISFLVLEDNEGDFMLLERTLRAACGRLVPGAHVEITHVETLAEAMTAVQTQAFDCAFVDLILSDNSGLDGLMRLHREAAAIPIVVLSGLNDAVVAVRAIKEGAKDYLVKGRYSTSTLVDTLTDAAPHLLTDGDHEVIEVTAQLPERIASQLSPRENDVLRELLRGSSIAEIGNTLGLSPHTVRNHFRSIYAKLGVNSQTKLLLLLRAA